MNRFQSWYHAQPRALRALLTINVVFYVLWVLLLSNISVTASFVHNHLALNPDGVLFEPWQLVTYNFLHLRPGFWGFIHILFNLLWLYWIGRDYEDLHGPHPLTALYLITGVGGGLLTVLLNGLFPASSVFGGNILVHGASASVLGVMTAVAVQYPFKKIGLLIIGTVRLIYVVVAFLVLDLLFLSGGGTAVGAHLGGALFGLLVVKVEQRGVDLTSWARFFFRGRRRSTQRASGSGDGESFLGRLESWLASRSKKDGPPRAEKKASRSSKLRPLGAEEEPESSIESEVDRILDKISEQGIESLTEEEKRLLEEASRR